MRIVFIGAGRLATNLALSLQKAGHVIVQVYSRTLTAASALSIKVGAIPIDNLNSVCRDADVYIIAVTDTALPDVIASLGENCVDGVFLHTAGSVPMSVFESASNHMSHYGVLYPMQTFSKERLVDFSKVSFFIEGNDEFSMNTARKIAGSVSNKIIPLSSEGRRYLHLAAVFACNFSNHCYQLSVEILARYGIPFNAMLPLIDETAAKVHEIMPLQAQTGPAARDDRRVMESQQQLLADDQFLAQIYKLMSESIRHSQEQQK